MFPECEKSQDTKWAQHTPGRIYVGNWKRNEPAKSQMRKSFFRESAFLITAPYSVQQMSLNGNVSFWLRLQYPVCCGFFPFRAIYLFCPQLSCLFLHSAWVEHQTTLTSYSYDSVPFHSTVKPHVYILQLTTFTILRYPELSDWIFTFSILFGFAHAIPFAENVLRFYSSVRIRHITINRCDGEVGSVYYWFFYFFHCVFIFADNRGCFLYGISPSGKWLKLSNCFTISIQFL